MANLNVLAPFILSWEGGYCNIKGDRGGATNKGVTLGTWRKYGYDKNNDGRIDEKDVMIITVDDAVEKIMRPVFWNAWKADSINSQAIANLLVDWLWGSGSYGIRIPQRVLGVKIDGIVGNKTLAAINNYPDPKELFVKLWHEREDFFKRIGVKEQKKFLNGWLNRLNAIRYDKLICNGGKIITF